MPLLLLLAACSGTPDAPRDYKDLPPEEAKQLEAKREATKPRPDTPEAALAHTRAAAQDVGKGLKQRLHAALQSGGPAEAVTACNTQAPKVSASVEDRTGVTVGRSSLRLRNPDNANAPHWVAAWLDAQGERPVEGVTGISEVVQTEGGPQARVLVPIGVEPVCVTCHGPAESLAPPVAARIQALYPNDRATGYAPGDLRGALWAEYPFRPPAGGAVTPPE